jgi:hypothetical protein
MVDETFTYEHSSNGLFSLNGIDKRTYSEHDSVALGLNVAWLAQNNCAKGYKN